MEFDFSLQNIFEAHGIALSLVGMAIVFCSLAIITIFIASLPGTLRKLDRLFGAKSTEPAEEVSEILLEKKKEDDILVAIATVLDTELRRPDGSAPLRLTLQRSGTGEFWGRAGRMRTLSSQNPSQR